MRSKLKQLILWSALLLCVTVALDRVSAKTRPLQSPSSIDSLSAAVTVSSSEVRGDGAITVPVRSLTYQLDGVKTANTWKMTITNPPAAPGVIRNRDGTVRSEPALGGFARMELDEAGGVARIYGADGKLLTPQWSDAAMSKRHLVTSNALPKAGIGRPRGPESGLDNVFATDSDADRRRQAIGQRMGSVVDRVRGLDRYQRHAGSDVVEALVDPVAVLPIELNRTRGGVLQAHTTYGYVAASGGGWIRNQIHVEQKKPDGTDGRLVMDVRLNNVQVHRGGVQ